MAFVQLLFPLAEVDAFLPEDHITAIGQAYHAELYAKLLKQPGLLLHKLADKAAAHIAGACDEEVELFIGCFEEFFVEDIDRLADVICGDDGGDIPFR